MDKITLRDLDGLKLLHSTDYVATIPEAQLALEAAYVQGSQGWGVGQAQANLLRLATELGRALVAEDKYEETQKALKAEQMRRGRVQKQLDTAIAQRDETRFRAEGYVTRIADLEAEATALGEAVVPERV